MTYEERTDLLNNLYNNSELYIFIWGEKEFNKKIYDIHYRFFAPKILANNYICPLTRPNIHKIVKKQMKLWKK